MIGLELGLFFVFCFLSSVAKISSSVCELEGRCLDVFALLLSVHVKDDSSAFISAVYTSFVIAKNALRSRHKRSNKTYVRHTRRLFPFPTRNSYWFITLLAPAVIGRSY